MVSHSKFHENHLFVIFSKNHVFGRFSTETGITENNSFISYGGPDLSRVYPQALSFRLPKYHQNRRVRPAGSEILDFGRFG